MSTGSEFRFLKEIPGETALRDVIDAEIDRLKKARDESVWGNVPEIGKFILMDGIWVNVSTGQKYSEMFCVYFNSMFSELKEEFGLDPYRRDQLEITEEMARDMRGALGYLKLGKYDQDIEELIGPRYIQVFRSLFHTYFNWKSREEDRLPGLEGDEYYQVGCRVLRALDAFLMISSELEFDDQKMVLLYTVW